MIGIFAIILGFCLCSGYVWLDAPPDTLAIGSMLVIVGIPILIVEGVNNA